MRFLRRLIIEGFKSFADRTVIDFSDGMTAVIGPNGSGKSNVTDAIRWVLGETSAKNLRGGKMEDVIFAGSASRPAMQRASVTMVLYNENGLFSSELGEEISVSRAYSKTKGSEYFINGDSCRQRDIHDLFMDSGIGSDSYSLVGQNQVQDLVSEDKQKRRAIFEEAAGIVKMKKQKEETETKLKQVEQSLIRFSDIITGLKEQVHPLKRQAEKALRHRDLTTQLREAEVDFYMREQSEMKGQLTVLQKEWDEAEQALSSVFSQLEEQELHVQSLKEEWDGSQQELSTIQTNIASQTEAVEKKLAQLQLIEQELSHVKESHSKNEEQLRSFEAKYSLSSEDVLGKQEELKQVAQTISELQQQAETLTRVISEAEANVTMLRIRHEKKKEDTISLYNELSVQGERRDSYEQEQQKTWKQIEQLQEKQKELKGRHAARNREGKEIQQKTADLQRSLQSLEAEEQLCRNRLTELQSKREQLHGEHRTKETKLLKLSSEREQLERIANNHEGYFEGVKHVLQESFRFPGVLGAVASALHVPEAYERALEELLQSSAQHIITRTEEDAKQVVHWLETQQKGRATFLPLTLAKPQQFSPSEQEIIGKYSSLHYAVDAVSFDEEYRPLMSMLLGRCLVADDLDSAISFVRTNRFHVKIATRNGQLVQASSITGGRQKGKNHLLSQKRRLQQLQEEERIESKVFHQLAQELQTTEEQLETEGTKLSSLVHALSDLRQQFGEHHTRERLWEQEQEQLEESSRSWALDEQEKRTELETLVRRVNELSETILVKRKQHETSQKDLEVLAQEMKGKEEELVALQAQKTVVMMELSRLQEEQKQTERALSHFGNQSDEVKIQLQYLTNEEQRFRDRQSILSMERETVHTEGATAQKLLRDMQKELSSQKERVSSFSAAWKESDAALQILRTQHTMQEKEVNKAQLSFEKEQTRYEQACRILQETYEIEEFSDSLPPLSKEEQRERKELIASLKKAVQSLGSVNLLAPEEYEEVNARYEEQKKQHDDIQVAEADLRELLRQVEKEMTTRFTASFEHVSTTFSSLFRQFFGGGEGKLLLEDPKQPLDSSIRIIAKPPGKKTEELRLLSGGERSLVAVVIIFAILTSKPSPFVILDELDAPLDEANIVRFTKHLRAFTQNSQFIVITHRKNTMMVVDNIYGVTHQEGVSMVLPLMLEDLDKRFVV